MQKVFHPKEEEEKEEEEEERTWKAFCHKLERRRRKKGKERHYNVSVEIAILKILFHIHF